MTDTQAGLVLFNAIATAGRTIYEIAQGTSKLETKQQLMEVYDTLMNLKREAANLEDENRELKQKLRLKSEDFEFRSPFYYENKHPDRALCTKCFVGSEKASPMGEPFKALAGFSRRCLVCAYAVEIGRSPSHNPGSHRGSGGPKSWTS